MRKLAMIMTLLLVVALTPAAMGQENATDLPDAGTTPDSAMYGLERAMERINLALTFGNANKAEKQLRYAEERVAEAQAVVAKGRPEAAQRALDTHAELVGEANANIEAAEADGENVTDVAQRVEQATSRHIGVLEGLLEQVPEQARQGIQTAIENSQRGRDRAMEAVSRRGAPNDTGAPENIGAPEGVGGAPEDAGGQAEEREAPQTDDTSGDARGGSPSGGGRP